MSGVNPGKFARKLTEAAMADPELGLSVAHIIQAALAALPQRDRDTLRDAAPALRDLTASIDAQADPDP